jgi:hypothetical protein
MKVSMMSPHMCQPCPRSKQNAKRNEAKKRVLNRQFLSVVVAPFQVFGPNVVPPPPINTQSNTILKHQRRAHASPQTPSFRWSMARYSRIPYLSTKTENRREWTRRISARRHPSSGHHAPKSSSQYSLSRRASPVRASSVRLNSTRRILPEMVFGNS